MRRQKRLTNNIRRKNLNLNVFVDTKGICLMVADVDESLIEKHDAQLLAYYAQYFHTEPNGMSLGNLQSFSSVQ